MVRRLLTGERLQGIPGNTWNWLVDGNQDNEQAIAVNAADNSQSQPEFGSSNVIAVINDSASNLPLRGCAGLEYGFDFNREVDADPHGLIGVRCVIPTDSQRGGDWGIVVNSFIPAATSANAGIWAGQLAVSGLVVALVDIKDTDHMYANVVDSQQANLDSNYFHGARIVSPITTTGIKNYIINLDTKFQTGSWEAESEGVITDNTSTGDLDVYDGSHVKSGDILENIIFKHATGAQNISDAKHVFFYWSVQQKNYAIVGAECE